MSTCKKCKGEREVVGVVNGAPVKIVCPICFGSGLDMEDENDKPLVDKAGVPEGMVVVEKVGDVRQAADWNHDTIVTRSTLEQRMKKEPYLIYDEPNGRLLRRGVKSGEGVIVRAEAVNTNKFVFMPETDSLPIVARKTRDLRASFQAMGGEPSYYDLTLVLDVIDALIDAIEERS